VADEYVWIYGEKYRWWPTPNGRVRPETWPEALPGCDHVLAYVRDPVGYARRELAASDREGTSVNLVSNGDFSSEITTMPEGTEVRWSEGRPPAGWGAWQEASSKGNFLWDKETGASNMGSARARSVANGCFIQGREAQPGDRYVVRAVTRTGGRGDTWIRVRWQTADGKWIAENKDRIFLPKETLGPWREIFGVVEVPDDAGRLVILLGVGRQESTEDIAFFDDVVLHRLP
jgi:hypothetical protein